MKDRWYPYNFLQFLLKNRNILSYFSDTRTVMKTYLGEFEELVLLTIATLGDDAYGVAIKDSIENRCDRSISIGALHSTITRLEEKRFLESWVGGATAERGGRSKRFYQLTREGKAALVQAKHLRDQLWAESKVKLSLQK